MFESTFDRIHEMVDEMFKDHVGEDTPGDALGQEEVIERRRNIEPLPKDED